MLYIKTNYHLTFCSMSQYGSVLFSHSLSITLFSVFLFPFIPNWALFFHFSVHSWLLRWFSSCAISFLSSCINLALALLRQLLDFSHCLSELRKMLLRSSSAPILSSLLPYSIESSPEQEPILHLPRTTSVLCLSHNLVETDLHSNTSSAKKKCCVPRIKVLRSQHSTKIIERDEAKKDPQQKTCMEAKPSIQGLFSSSGLDKVVLDHEGCDEGRQDGRLQTSVMGGGMGSNGGLICGGYNGSGRGSDGRQGRGWDFSEGNNHGRDRIEAYYQDMIEANPNDALLLGNYAKFLKEVCGDYPRAKEFFERAILASPGDGHVLSLYADLIWQTEKNPDRAEGYFDQAIKSAPDDCYAMASYAKFLWEVEEDDEDCPNKSDDSYIYSPDLFQGTNHRPHLTAAS